MVTAKVTLLGPDESRDEVLVEELADLINAAYAVGEAGLWLEGTTRTGPGEIAEAIRSGGVLAAGSRAASSAARTCAPWTRTRRIWASSRPRRTGGATASAASWCARRRT